MTLDYEIGEIRMDIEELKLRLDASENRIEEVKKEIVNELSGLIMRFIDHCNGTQNHCRPNSENLHGYSTRPDSMRWHGHFTSFR